MKGNFDADGCHCGTSGGGYAEGRGRRRGGGHPDRSVFWNAQTPQVFRAGIYRRAHASALSDGFVGTDDSSLIERLGGKVLIVEGKRDNIKLTVPEDYVLLASAVRTMLLNSEHRWWSTKGPRREMRRVLKGVMHDGERRKEPE